MLSGLVSEFCMSSTNGILETGELENGITIELWGENCFFVLNKVPILYLDVAVLETEKNG